MREGERGKEAHPSSIRPFPDKHSLSLHPTSAAVNDDEQAMGW